MSTVSHWIETKGKRFKDKDKMIAAGATRFHVSQEVFADFVAGKRASIYPVRRKKGGPGSGPRRSRESAASTATAAAGFSRADFGATNDPDTKVRVTIRNALARLDKDQSLDAGGNPVRDSIWSDVDFRHKVCRLSSHNWKQIVDEEEFLKFQFEMRGKRYWALPHTIKDYVFKELPLAQEVTL